MKTTLYTRLQKKKHILSQLLQRIQKLENNTKLEMKKKGVFRLFEGCNRQNERGTNMTDMQKELLDAIEEIALEKHDN